MKIVSRKEFIALPKDVLFCTYEPEIFGDLQIKSSEANQYENDFVVDYLNLFVDSEKETRELENFGVGTEFRWDDNQKIRDGNFDGEEVMFCIFDNEDIEQLINKLKRCIK